MTQPPIIGTVPLHAANGHELLKAAFYDLYWCQLCNKTFTDNEVLYVPPCTHASRRGQMHCEGDIRPTPDFPGDQVHHEIRIGKPKKITS